MKKTLTKRQKTIEQTRLLKDIINNELMPNIINQLKESINNSKYDLTQGDDSFVNSILKKPICNLIYKK